MIEEVATHEQLERCWAIRLEVFVEEQKVSEDEEIDAIDLLESTVHFLASRDGVDLGTARIVAEEAGRCHIGRVAVRKLARGTGVGRELMEEAARIAVERCPDSRGNLEIVISAQEHAIPFYESCGYVLVSGERYLDAGIWHRDMVAHFSRQ